MVTKPGRKRSGLAMNLIANQVSADATGEPDPQVKERLPPPPPSQGSLTPTLRLLKTPLWELSHPAVSPRCTEPPSRQTLQEQAALALRPPPASFQPE